MKIVSVGLIAAVCAFGQAGRLDGGYSPGPGFSLYWETRLEPSSPQLAQSLGTKMVAENGTFTHVLLDRGRRTYLGYAMVVAARNGAYNVYVRPQVRLTPELARAAHIEDAEAWKENSRSITVHEKVVHTGEVIAFDLMVNPTTGQKIVDYIAIQEPFVPSFNRPTPFEFSYVGGTPRDFRLEDVQLRIRTPLLTMNGQVVESSRGNMQDTSGTVLTMYVPNRGRYSISLLQQPGFQKAGEVRGTSLTFRVGSDTFGVSSAVRIAPGDAPFNLYVSHDPGGAGTSFQVGL